MQRMQHAAYIQALPQTIDLPVVWPADDVQRLCCAHAKRQVAEQRKQWDDWWATVKDAKRGGNTIEQADLDWALACVVSRAFKGPFIGSSKRVRPFLRL